MGFHWSTFSKPNTEFNSDLTGRPGPPSLLSSGYRSSFPRGKATGSWSWPLTSIKCRG